MKEKMLEKEAIPEHLQSGISVDINQPFRGMKFIANKQLKADDWDKLENTIPQEECLQFVIVGDLNIHGKYAYSFLAVTDKGIYGFDDSFEGGVRKTTYDRIKKATVKRYYGNAILIFTPPEEDGERDNFLRFS